MKQIEHWNNVADSKEFDMVFHMEMFNKYVQKNASILEIGCGYGRILNALFNAGYKNSVGLDFSSKMIERGKKLFPHLALYIIENDKINYPENTFDVIILFGVLTCIIDDIQQIKLINRIKHLLKSNGVICVHDFLLYTDKKYIEKYINYAKLYGNYGIFELEYGVTFRHHTKEWMNKLFGVFEKLECHEMTYTTKNGIESNRYYYIGRKEQIDGKN